MQKFGQVSLHPRNKTSLDRFNNRGTLYQHHYFSPLEGLEGCRIKPNRNYHVLIYTQVLPLDQIHNRSDSQLSACQPDKSRTPITISHINRSSLCSRCTPATPPALYSTHSLRNSACADVQVREPHTALHEDRVCCKMKSVGGAKTSASRMLGGFDGG